MRARGKFGDVGNPARLLREQAVDHAERSISPFGEALIMRDDDERFLSLARQSQKQIHN